MPWYRMRVDASGFLTIQSDGPRIISTNYWESEPARAGAFFVSTNSGTFRLLLPSQLEASLAAMRTAKEVIISRGPWPHAHRADALELLFEDNSDTPFALHVGIEQVDRMPLDTDAGRQCMCTVWTAGPTQRLVRPAHYRRVTGLPCLAPR
jgi:hypothetical protein